MNTKKKQQIVMATVKGRHQMPVDRFIFEGEIENPSDHKAIYEHVERVLKETVSAQDELVVYVTGLTTVTVAVVKYCALNGVALALMHYDRDSGDYVSDQVFERVC